LRFKPPCDPLYRGVHAMVRCLHARVCYPRVRCARCIPRRPVRWLRSPTQVWLCGAPATAPSWPLGRGLCAPWSASLASGSAPCTALTRHRGCVTGGPVVWVVRAARVGGVAAAATACVWARSHGVLVCLVPVQVLPDERCPKFSQYPSWEQCNSFICPTTLYRVLEWDKCRCAVGPPRVNRPCGLQRKAVASAPHYARPLPAPPP
jgi:hypothetical protein